MPNALKPKMVEEEHRTKIKHILCKVFDAELGKKNRSKNLRVS